MRTFKLEDKAHIYDEENSPHTVKECLEYIIKNYKGDLDGIKAYFAKLLKDGGGTTEHDEGIPISYKNTVFNEDFGDYETIREYADIIFE